MNRPKIAITMGDAAGIGAEVIVKTLEHPDVYELCRPLVVGDARRLTQAVQIVGAPLAVHAIREPEEGGFAYGAIDCIDLALVPNDTPFGKLSAACGEAAYRFIERAVELAQAGEIDGLSTAPINKEALHAAGRIFPGHTELLAHLSQTPEVSLMLIAPNLRVIHVTAHVGLLDAVERIEPGLVERTIARGRTLLVRIGIGDPRIAVCGINPHAGEHGLFGRGEEETKVAPAIEACRARGWRVDGPLPADTLFFRALRGDFDLVVAMYHDQGHAPVKALSFDVGVNVTAGLPFVRTSVDHGTAFDIAGTGRADERSMIAALRQAVELAAHEPSSPSG